MGTGIVLGLTDGTMDMALSRGTQDNSAWYMGTATIGAAVGTAPKQLLGNINRGVGLHTDSSLTGIVGVSPDVTINSEKLGRFFIKF